MFSRMMRDEAGQSLIEYTALLAFIAAAALTAFLVVGPTIKSTYNQLDAKLATLVTGQPAADAPSDAPATDNAPSDSTPSDNKPGKPGNNDRHTPPKHGHDDGRGRND